MSTSTLNYQICKFIPPIASGLRGLYTPSRVDVVNILSKSFRLTSQPHVKCVSSRKVPFRQECKIHVGKCVQVVFAKSDPI